MVKQLQSAYGFSQPQLGVFPPPVISNANPNLNNKEPKGTIWINQLTNDVYILTSYTDGIPDWEKLTRSGGPGVFSSLTVIPGPTNITGLTNINFDGAGNTNIGTGTNTGNIVLGNPNNNVLEIEGNPNSGLAVNSNGGPILFGLDLDGGADIAIGNPFPNTSFIKIYAGSPVFGTSFSIQGQPNSILTFGVGLGTGTITIGDSSQTGAITLGNSSADGNIVNVGTGNGAGTINIGTGTGDETINIGTGSGTNTINIGTDNGANNDITIGGGDTSSVLVASGDSISFISVTSNVTMAPQFDTTNTLSATLNVRVGTVTFTGLTLTAGSTVTVGISNSFVETSSSILAFASNLSTNGAYAAIIDNTLTTGLMAITLGNSSGFDVNGNIIISFWIFT